MPTANGHLLAIHLAAIGNRQSAIGNRQSAIGNRQSAIGNRQSAIGNRQSNIELQYNRTAKPQAKSAILAIALYHGSEEE
ncbi:hypothetical protein ACE1BM_14725 [Aeromonas jandaei]